MISSVTRKPVAVFLSNNEATLKNVASLSLDKIFDMHICHTVFQLHNLIETAAPQLILIDASLMTDCGWPQLQRLTDTFSDLVFVVVALLSDPRWVFEAGRFGAFEYIDLSLSSEKVLHALENTIEFLKTKATAGRPEGIRNSSLEDYYGGTSKAMQSLIESLVQIAPSNANVLIQGESGTGKEVLANLIHTMSNQSKKSFVAVNCAAIPENLIESELFGHVKGSFTGAAFDKKGLFEEAHQGTLFLDEIGDLSLQLQAKILRVLQDQKVRSVGATKSIQVDVRLIAATHKNLRAMISDGSFREDLFYRLNVLPLNLPPLRERTEDIPALVSKFLQKFSEKSNLPKTIGKSGIAALMAYRWPGNIRELENLIERVSVLSTASEVPVDLLNESLYPRNLDQVVNNEKGRPTLKEVEDNYIQMILEENEFQKDRAATVLGISRRTLYRKDLHRSPQDLNNEVLLKQIISHSANPKGE